MVCKTWSKSVLDYLRDYPSKRPAENTIYSSDILLPLNELGIFPIRLKTAVDLKRHIKKLKKSNNPLPIYSVDIYLGRDEIFEYVFQGNEWFILFGHHVLYLTFFIEMFNSNMLFIYQTLRDWILNCPNLRSLTVRGNFQRTDDNYETTLQTLATQVKIYGFDFGPNLECFQHCFENLPSQIRKSAFKALGNSLKKLSFPLDQWNNKVEQMFTSVTDLEIENIISIVMLHDFIRACFPSNTKLQRLRLVLRITLDWTDLLIILRIISAKSLEIDYDFSQTRSFPLLTNVHHTRLTICSLERLIMFDSKGLTYDFLVNFPSLKFLHVNPIKSSATNMLEFQNSFENEGVKRIDKTIRSALYNAIEPDFYLWLTLVSLQKFSVGPLLLNGPGTTTTYARNVFIRRRLRVVLE